MDYESLRTSLDNFVNSPNAVYTAVGTVSAAAGYAINSLFHRRRLRFAELESDARIAEAHARQAEAEASSAEFKYKSNDSDNRLELERLNMADAEGNHKRALELAETQRRFNLEDKTAEREHEKENNQLYQQQEQVKHQRRLELATRLIELKPIFERYLHDLNAANVPGTGSDCAYLTQRDKYRAELIEKALDHITDGDEDGLMERLIDNEEEALSEELVDRIDNLVEDKYPLSKASKSSAPQMPPELKCLVALILNEDK